MTSTPADDELRARRLLLAITYRGPWERLEGLCYGVRPDNSLRFEIPASPRGWRAAAGALGDFCDRRDAAWRGRHARNGTRPRLAWTRKGP